MRFELVDIFGWDGAIRGMRNPLESWSKSDTGWFEDTETNAHKCNYQVLDVNYDNLTFKAIGPNDLTLMQKLIKGGPEHRKFLRYIHVQFDMTAPLYFWSEFDTYKIGTVANSTSKMHKLASTPITLDCFEIDDLVWNLMISDGGGDPTFDIRVSDRVGTFIEFLEDLRQKYLETKDKRCWKELIRWLPESWLQTRTIDLNYEVLRNIVHQRKGHKLTEWHQFIDFVHTLPYADELIFYANDNDNSSKFDDMMKEIDRLGDNPFQSDLMKIIEKYKKL